MLSLKPLLKIRFSTFNKAIIVIKSFYSYSGLSNKLSMQKELKGSNGNSKSNLPNLVILFNLSRAPRF